MPLLPSKDAPTDGRSKELLDSWKEIAVFLNRGVRTVQRWERDEGLPVHRHSHGKRSTVFAFASEIQDWVNSRSNTDVAAKPTAHSTIFYRNLDSEELMARCTAARALAAKVRHIITKIYEEHQREARGLANLNAHQVSDRLMH
jgi:hypothetical protein